ncbi:MAG TPA: hypothetical protein EYG79_02940 [Rhodobacteraceae bacterium]|nr:hypothetical protein [Paracoccaceae bacterium]
MKLAAALFTLFAGAASAQPLTGKEFDALSRGSTMHFTADGQFYGSEQFFFGQRTVWRSEDGRCVNGKWAYEAPAICFVYDDGSGPFCWTIEGDAEHLTVTSTSNDEGEPPLALTLSGQDKSEILCTGPLFGVSFQP